MQVQGHVVFVDRAREGPLDTDTCSYGRGAHPFIRRDTSVTRCSRTEVQYETQPVTNVKIL